MAAETNFGDGRSADEPLAVVQLGPDGEAISATNPTYVAIADGTLSATVVRAGADANALMTTDRAVRRLLEEVLLELQTLNQRLAR